MTKTSETLVQAIFNDGTLSQGSYFACSIAAHEWARKQSLHTRAIIVTSPSGMTGYVNGGTESAERLLVVAHNLRQSCNG